MSLSLTEKEKMLLGKVVVSIKRLNYGHQQIDSGSKGVIVDFGRESNDPLIFWSCGFESFEGYAPWDSIELC